MQATQIRGAKGAQWFGNHRLGSTLMIVALLVVGTLAAIAAVQVIDSSDTPGNSRPVIALKSHYVPQAGEGLLGGTTAVSARPKAYYVPEAGEGRIGAERLGDAAPAKAFDGDAYLTKYLPGFDLAELKSMSAEEMRFIEVNTQLPGSDGTVLRDPAIVIQPMLLFHRWLFLERNMLPEAPLVDDRDSIDRWGNGIGPTAY